MTATMMHPMRGISIAALNDKIYVAGGGYSRSKGNRLASGEVFVLDNAKQTKAESASCSWELLSEQMIVARWGHSSTAYRKAVWVAGGLDSANRLLNSVEFFDPKAGVAGVWAPGPPMVRGRFGVHLLIVLDELFAVGGDNECLGVSIEKLDMKTMKWAMVCEYEGGGARWGCAATSVGSKIFVFGGGHPDGTKR